MVATMISTTPVTSAPKPLIAAWSPHAGSQLAPVDHHAGRDSVNETKTPIMYSGMSACVSR